MKTALPYTFHQALLIDVRPQFVISSNAEARNFYGALAQDIACQALHLVPIPIDGTKEICFDAVKYCGDKPNFFEIKSVNSYGKLIVYKWRLDKEVRFAISIAKTSYAIVIHHCKRARTSDELFDQFSESVIEIHLISPITLATYIAAIQLPLNEIKTVVNGGTRCGYNRKGYKDGYYNVPLDLIKSLTQYTKKVYFHLYGRQFQVKVFEEKFHTPVPEGEEEWGQRKVEIEEEVQYLP